MGQKEDYLINFINRISIFTIRLCNENVNIYTKYNIFKYYNFKFL